MTQPKRDFGLMMIINAIFLIGVASAIMGTNTIDHTTKTHKETERPGTIRVVGRNQNARPLNATVFLQPAMTARDIQPTIQGVQLQ